MDTRLELRLVGEDDLSLLAELTQDPAVTGEYQWFGWNDLNRWRRSWDENGLIGTDGGTLLAVRGSERLGLVNWRRRQITPAGGCWQIGVIMRPEARGRGYGTQAHILLARYLFAHTTAHRIEAATEVGNVAEQKALQRAGFSSEGVQRGGGWRDGSWRDGVGFSLLRTDPQPKDAA